MSNPAAPMNTRQAANEIPVPGKPTIALDAPPEANKIEAPNTAKIAKVFLLCVELLKIHNLNWRFNLFSVSVAN
ncbi:MAG: hypothetical protein RLZZ571_31 [Actinomycetota bacterium]